MEKGGRGKGGKTLWTGFAAKLGRATKWFIWFYKQKEEPVFFFLCRKENSKKSHIKKIYYRFIFDLPKKNQTVCFLFVVKNTTTQNKPKQNNKQNNKQNKTKQTKTNQQTKQKSTTPMSLSEEMERACRLGKHEVVKKILSSHPESINFFNKVGNLFVFVTVFYYLLLHLNLSMIFVDLYYDCYL